MTSMAGTTRQRPRTCVACKEESPKRALIRVVRAPDGTVALDERGKLPGRGAYVCARAECVVQARKTKALSRALKTEIPAEFYDRLEDYLRTYGKRHDGGELRRELHSLLGLSRRAGVVYIGTDSVKSQSAKESLLILAAADCSSSVGKVAAGKADAFGHLFFRLPLTAAELSAALGALNVQVIALPERSGLADKIKMLLQEGGIALEQNASV